MIRADVGGITESDVNLAAATDAIIIGFNVRPVGEARLLAEREGVEIRTYAVIYKAFDDLRDAMQGLLAPEEVEETVGEVEIRQTFRASQIGVIAGSYVTEGTRHPRRQACASCATARWCGRARSSRCAAIPTTCARSPPASSAASCCATTRTSRRATCSRSTRPSRSSASFQSVDAAAHAFVAVLRIHLHFPDAGSLKAKRSELNAVKAGLQQRFGVAARRGRPPGQLAALDAAGVRLWPAAMHGCSDHRRRRRALARCRGCRKGARVERRVASWADLESIG